MQKLTPAKQTWLERWSQCGPEDVVRQVKGMEQAHAKRSMSRRFVQQAYPALKGLRGFSEIAGVMVRCAPNPSAVLCGGILCLAQVGVAYAAVAGIWLKCDRRLEYGSRNHLGGS
jgi:hypothetical protein